VSKDIVAMSATVRFEAPKRLYVVIKFDGTVSSAMAHDDSPYDYDLDENECLLTYVLDESAAPLCKLLEGDTGEAKP
jgi:hypothetical protein